jgi:signal transduction histidine kinase
VDSLLILARADAGFLPEAADPVPVNDVVMDAVQRCEPTARQREIRLIPQLSLPPGDEACLQIHGDPALLRAMCENLIRNAVRHSPPGEAVEVEVALAYPDVILQVRDRGPGLPAEALEQVFERFYRVPRGDQPGQGTGLGLAIAKAVVVLHGGSARAANRPEGGCEFVVRLPLAPLTPRVAD